MKKKLLLVDDIREFRILLKIFLQKFYDIETAGNGQEALALLHEGYTPDIIVTDILMPEIDGKAFVKQLKASGAFNQIPVLILSSIDHSTEKIQLLKAGADDYLIKPFNPEELKVRIEATLRNIA
ncbi:MAG: two-component system response regulator [Ignavibacteriae bacterium]|nr:MAG: two-component system response regulator [Ignavibacteriota bacterium]